MTLAPWDYLFQSFNNDNFPDIFHPTWIAALVLLVVLTILYNVRTRALASPPAVPRDVGMAVVDRPHHVQPADHRIALRVRLLHRPRHRDRRAWPRWSGSGSSGSRRSSRPTRRSWRASATSRSRSSPTPKRPSRSAPAAVASSGSAAGDRRPGPVPIEIRRFGVGHRRPDGPIGSVGLTGQVIHSDGRGTVVRAGLRAQRADRAARQPEHDLVHRHRGRRLGRGR